MYHIHIKTCLLLNNKYIFTNQGVTGYGMILQFFSLVSNITSFKTDWYSMRISGNFLVELHWINLPKNCQKYSLNTSLVQDVSSGHSTHVIVVTCNFSFLLLPYISNCHTIGSIVSSFSTVMINRKLGDRLIDFLHYFS